MGDREKASNKPDDRELLRQYQNHTQAQLAEMYGTKITTISSWITAARRRRAASICTELTQEQLEGLLHLRTCLEHTQAALNSLHLPEDVNPDHLVKTGSTTEYMMRRQYLTAVHSLTAGVRSLGAANSRTLSDIRKMLDAAGYLNDTLVWDNIPDNPNAEFEE